MSGALLVAGTHSDAGKSLVAAGLCRWLHRRGVSVAPFRLHAGEAEREMELKAGFFGVAQDQRTLALRPEIGWAVRQAPPPAGAG